MQSRLQARALLQGRMCQWVETGIDGKSLFPELELTSNEGVLEQGHKRDEKGLIWDEPRVGTGAEIG
jgi:hypothetical protein